MIDNEEKSKKSYYFKLGDAVDDFSYASGMKEKTSAIAKLVGKTMFNTTLFTGKLGLDVVKALPDILAEKVKEQAKYKK